MIDIYFDNFYLHTFLYNSLNVFIHLKLNPDKNKQVFDKVLLKLFID